MNPKDMRLPSRETLLWLYKERYRDFCIKKETGDVAGAEALECELRRIAGIAGLTLNDIAVIEGEINYSRNIAKLLYPEIDELLKPLGLITIH